MGLMLRCRISKSILEPCAGTSTLYVADAAGLIEEDVEGENGWLEAEALASTRDAIRTSLSTTTIRSVPLTVIKRVWLPGVLDPTLSVSGAPCFGVKMGCEESCCSHCGSLRVGSGDCG